MVEPVEDDGSTLETEDENDHRTVDSSKVSTGNAYATY